MLFTLNRPKSKRSYQLRFKGFSPNKKVLVAFFSAIFFYIVKKINDLIRLIFASFSFLNRFPTIVKAYLVKKLIWSRGRLGRPIANLAVFLLAFLVFMFGEVLNSSKFVSSGDVNPDYLSYTTDIIPNLNTATTTIPESRKRDVAFEYTIVGGDTLFSIGEQFKISTDALKYVNSLTDYSILKVGQKLVIPPISGLIHKVESGDSLASIALKYEVPAQAIADFNYILDTSKLALGTELVIPGAKIPQPAIVSPVTQEIISVANLPQAQASKNFCVWPTSVRIVTQYFSWYHNGMDIATPSGRGMPPIYACTGGTVVRAGWDPWGLGLHVRVDHGNGYMTIYGHMSSLNVSYGQHVSRGSVIGIMGSTGHSTGPHVHFMVQYNGVAQNPQNYMN